MAGLVFYTNASLMDSPMRYARVDRRVFAMTVCMCPFPSAFWRSIAACPVTRSDDPTSNQLLAALPSEELTRWRHQLELVQMSAGLVLCESGSRLRHAWFPCTAVVSLLHVTVSGQSVEIAMVGNDGVVGISSFLGGGTPNRAVVQRAGMGYRMSAPAIKAEFHRSAPVMQLFLRYTQALITQIAQTAVCNRHHSVDQRLCRWLLKNLDRIEGNDLSVTQELIADMLGVRREGVTEVAHKLKRAGLISYARGHMKVLDRRALEQRTCECYAVVKAEYARLLPNEPG